MNHPLLALYSGSLIRAFAMTTATGLSQRLDHAVSHDRITRFLSGADDTSRDRWAQVKPTVRAVEADDGRRSFDDTIEDKPHSDEPAIIAWHFDHCANRAVKGVNRLNGLYQAGGVSIPVAFASVHQDLPYGEGETRKLKRHSAFTQSEHLRQRLRGCGQNTNGATGMCWPTTGSRPRTTWPSSRSTGRRASSWPSTATAQWH